MTEYPDIMVDIETTGTRPEHSAILQISAVKFNLDTQEVDPDFFDKCLMPLSTRSWDEDTRDWWLNGQPEVLREIYSRMEPAPAVVRSFYEWVIKTPSSGPNFWAKPISFDYTFLASYFSELNIPNPFPFFLAKDLNSFIRGRYFPEPGPNLTKTLPFVGDEHNGLHDVLHQIKAAFHAIDETRS